MRRSLWRCYTNQSCQVLHTSGDSACAIHAVFGDSHASELYLPNACQFWQDSYTSSATGVRAKINDAVLCNDFTDDLWKNSVQPFARLLVVYGLVLLTMLEIDVEARLILG